MISLSTLFFYRTFKTNLHRKGREENNNNLFKDFVERRREGYKSVDGVFFKNKKNKYVYILISEAVIVNLSLWSFVIDREKNNI